MPNPWDKLKVGNRVQDTMALAKRGMRKLTEAEIQAEAPGEILAIERTCRPAMAKVLWDGEARGEWVHLHELRALPHG